MSIAVTLPNHRTTATEYLDFERGAEYKNEFVNGLIRAMSGASRKHNRVTVNLTREISAQLKNSRCEDFAGDMRVKVSASGNYRYPDLVVVCGEPKFEDRELDTLLNPTLIVEVLSKSTQEEDRTNKFNDYKSIPTFSEYLLVAQNRVFVEQYVLDGENWSYKTYTEADEIVYMPTIGCAVAMVDVYYRVPGIELTASSLDAYRNGDS